MFFFALLQNAVSHACCFGSNGRGLQMGLGGWISCGDWEILKVLLIDNR